MAPDQPSSSMPAAHVVQTIASLWLGSGTTSAALHAANGCVAAGLGASIVSWDGPDSMDPNAFAPGVRLVSLSRPADPLSRFRTFYSNLLAHVSDLRRLNKLVLVHDHGLWLESNFAAGLASRRHHLPLLISPHGMLSPWAMCHRRSKKWFAWHAYQKRILRAAARLHVTAPAEHNETEALLPGVCTSIIPLGVSGICPPSDCATTRALFLSRIHPVKGLDLLLKAWADVSPPGWELIIAGPDSYGYGRELRNVIQSLDLQSSVHVVGPLFGEAKNAALRSASLFVLPSRSENFGIVAAEAMMAGLPVITTTATPWHGIRDNECGWVVPPESKALAVALKAATRLPPAQRREIGLRARAWMTSAYSWEIYRLRMVELYRDIVLRHELTPAK